MSKSLDTGNTFSDIVVATLDRLMPFSVSTKSHSISGKLSRIITGKNVIQIENT